MPYKAKMSFASNERDILLPPALCAVWPKAYPFPLLGSSPIPRQSADASLTEHHKICGGYAALHKQKGNLILFYCSAIKVYYE